MHESLLEKVELDTRHVKKVDGKSKLLLVNLSIKHETNNDEGKPETQKQGVIERSCIADVTRNGSHSKSNDLSKSSGAETNINASDNDENSTLDTIASQKKYNGVNRTFKKESDKEDFNSNNESIRAHNCSNEDEGSGRNSKEKVGSGRLPSLLRETDDITSLLPRTTKRADLYQTGGIVSTKDHPTEEPSNFTYMENDVSAAAQLPVRNRGRTAEEGGPSSYRGVIW